MLCSFALHFVGVFNVQSHPIPTSFIPLIQNGLFRLVSANYYTDTDMEQSSNTLLENKLQQCVYFCITNACSVVVNTYVLLYKGYMLP